MLPPTHGQPRPKQGGGNSFWHLKKGEKNFQALQLLLPRHCSAAWPLPLFYLRMPFYLCCYCRGGKIPFYMVEGEALHPPPLLRFPGLPEEQKQSRCHKILTTLHQTASHVPNPTCSRAAGACWPAGFLSVRYLSQLAEKRGDFCAETRRKVLIRLCLKPVGWSKQEGRRACREVPAASLSAGGVPDSHLFPYPSLVGAWAACGGSSEAGGEVFLLCRIGLVGVLMGLWKYSPRETIWGCQ